VVCKHIELLRCLSAGMGDGLIKQKPCHALQKNFPSDKKLAVQGI
jgi:hypothetical protein